EQLQSKFAGSRPANAAPRILEFDETPEFNHAETLAALEAASSGQKKVNIPKMLEATAFGKAGRLGTDLADALRASEFYRLYKNHITEAEVIAEGNEAVVIRVKG